MKFLLKFSLVLSLCAANAYSATKDLLSDFLQSQSAYSFQITSEIVSNLPIAERVNRLLVASYCCDSNTVAKLAEAGVSLDSTNAGGVNALMLLSSGTRYAYYSNASVELANYLVRHGTKLEAQDKNGRTAADWAFEYGRYSLLPLLDASGKYKSFYADGAKVKALGQLIQTVGNLSIESMSCGGNFPAESYNEVKVIADALKAGANPDQEILQVALGGSTSDDYWLPLGHIMPEAISELVKHGAIVNDPLSNGLQPLFYTVSKPTLFKMLLNAGADPKKSSLVAWTDWSDVRSSRGSMPGFELIKEPIICEAAEFGVAETLQMLLDRGVSIEERDSRGNTPLLRAIDFANADTIAFLLKHHASLQATNNQGQDALALAAARMNVNFVRTYDKAGLYHKVLEDFPGDPKSPVLGRWALESTKTNLFLRLDPQGGGEAFHNWEKPIAWKVNDKAIEISIYYPRMPRLFNGELMLGWIEYHVETDTCVLRWQDSSLPIVKLVRMK